MKHILFATDFSPPAQAAVARLIELAAHQDARVTLHHVNEHLDPLLVELSAFAADTADEIEQELNTRAWARLEELKARLETAGVAMTDIACESGHAGQKIVELATSLGSDLIVIGRHGLGSAGSLLLGSTCNYVLHHSPCAVMVVPS